MRTSYFKPVCHKILCCILFLGFGLSVLGQGLFTCADTHYGKDSQANILRSKYHLIQIFGDASIKKTSFYQKNYNGSGFWMEGRFFFPRFSTLIDSKKDAFPFPDLYFTSIIKDQKSLDWEDRIDYGGGVEWRPFKNFEDFTGVATWLYHMRFYAVYLKTKFLRYQREFDWRPTNDFRYGIEVYRECNLYNGSKSRFWSELWSDFSWRKSNFVVNDFQTWTFSIVPKWGIKIFPDNLSIMPYITGELSVTSRELEFWQNRALVGFGVRTMPFKNTVNLTGTFLKGMRIYVEGNFVVAYLKDAPPSGTPDYDVRLGITYVINRW